MPTPPPHQHAFESRWLPQFGVLHLLVATTVIAFGALLYRLLGPFAFYGLCCVVHGLAPTLALLAFLKLRGLHLVSRLCVVLGLLGSLTGLMLLLTIWNFGATATPWLLVAMLVEWPGQIPFSLVLLSITHLSK